MAQPGNKTRGFGARFLYVNEVVEGVTPANPAMQKVSDHVSNVSVSMDPKMGEYRDIGDFDPSAFIPGMPTYGLKVTFLLHETRPDLLFQAINRLSNNDLQSQTLEASFGRDGPNPGFFTLRGAKASDAEVKGEVGKPISVTLTYEGLALDIVNVEPSVGSGSREVAALGAVARFGTSHITRGGAVLAWVTRSATLRVSHKLDVDGTDGQDDPKSISPGARTITGTVDMSLDDGGVALAQAVKAGAANDITFNLGATGAPAIVANGAFYENLTVEGNTDDGALKRSVPFRAKSVTTGTVP